MKKIYIYVKIENMIIFIKIIKIKIEIIIFYKIN
jgi:hypothetical protein